MRRFLLPHYDASGILKFQKNEPQVFYDSNVDVINRELTEILLNDKFYSSLLPFLNHNSSFRVIFQMKNMHDWDIYPYLLDDNEVKCIIIAEILPDSRIIETDEEHSFKISRDREEIDADAETDIILKSIDFLTSGYIGLLTIDKNQMNEVHCDSYLLFSNFYTKFKNELDLSCELFEYFKRSELMILSNIFPTLKKDIEVFNNKMYEKFQILSDIIEMIRQKKEIDIELTDIEISENIFNMICDIIPRLKHKVTMMNLLAYLNDYNISYDDMELKQC